jgi:transposase InsO family protein
MSPAEKAFLLNQVESRPWGKRRTLKELGIPKSTYYRWRRGKPGRDKRRPWNHITPNEERRILAVAREFPDLSSRQLSAWITDNEGFAVSESTVYRILKREGLVKRQEMEIPAAQEYHTKTKHPHQMWATDASYFKVAGWGYYYLVTVMDDYSRFILGWKLQKDMSANSLIEVVQEAVDYTGMTEVPVEDRTRLLSDIFCRRPSIPRLTAR